MPTALKPPPLFKLPCVPDTAPSVVIDVGADGKVIRKKEEPAVVYRNIVNVTGRSRVNRAALGINGHWKFDRPMNPKRMLGFIYLVRDNYNEKFYIGKKNYKGRGATNKDKESNWKWYTSSSDPLNEAIAKHGKQHFDFFVIEEYRTVSTLAFAESWSLLYVESPFNHASWYNVLVNKVSWRCFEPLTAKHKLRLRQILDGVELPEIKD